MVGRLARCVIATGGLALGSCVPPRAATTPEPAAPEPAAPEPAAPEPAVEALRIGQALTLESRVLGEPRRINVLVPTVYGEAIDAPLPVLYVLDGGASEDFLHVAGLVQVLVGNAGMRPFLVVGIESGAGRRRDMTGPTNVPEDLAIAPQVGGSAAFRRFLAEEVAPAVARRYRVTDEAAIVGESLAGLFVVETLLLEPELFDAYVAIDPSLWWADEALVRSASAHLAARAPRGKAVFLASSGEPELAELTARLAEALASASGVAVHHERLVEESHATVHHPASLRAFRALFGPPAP